MNPLRRVGNDYHYYDNGNEGTKIHWGLCAIKWCHYNGVASWEAGARPP